MEQRKVVDEREARALLGKVARSGRDLGWVARAHGVDGRSLNAWRINLGRKGGSATTVQTRRAARRARASGLVELVPRPLSDSATGTERGRYTLRVGGVEVEFDDEVRGETLRRVLEVLQSC
jgi:hypothetical protein